MHRLAAGLLALTFAAHAFLFAAPGAARAQDSTAMTVLSQIPADEALFGKYRFFDFVDLAALRQASGLPEGIRLADMDAMAGPAQDLMMQMFRRMMVTASFTQYLLIDPNIWTETLGFDFMEADWVSQPGTPPTTLLMFGGEAIPRDEGLAILADADFVRQERGGTVVWVKGEKDNFHDPKRSEPGFPFWGHLGSSVRLFRGEAALVGARSFAVLDLALAVERGEAESLADLPSYRLAAAAANDPGLSGGPVMQMVFVDEAFGDGALGLEPVEGGLPAYDLYAIADREDASGQQVVLVLTYGDPLLAKQAASQLAAALLSYEDQRGDRLNDRFPDLEAQPSVVRTEDGAAAVVRLATPPEPAVDENGMGRNRSRLYQHLYEMILYRDVGYLAPGT